MLTHSWHAVATQFTQHEHCSSLDTWATSGSMAANITIAISYMIIPLILVRVAKARSDFKFSLNFWLFFLFNMLYGTSSLLKVYCMKHDDFTMATVLRTISAMAAVGTVGVLWTMVPRLVNLPSTKNLEELNKQLKDKVQELDDAVVALRIEREEKEKVQASLLQSQKMEAIGQLTGGIAHDFNNLLFAISGNLELIQRNPNSERVGRWVGSGINAVERAAHLTAQLLTFSRVQKLQLKQVSLKPLLTNVRDMIVRTIGPSVKVVVTSLDAVEIMADKVQLELAILNLSINARDAMSEGGTLTITTSVIEGFVEIDVTDTGHGIPPEVAARVFEPFFTTKDIGKGTGLGLSMVYGIAVQSHGDVYIKKTSPKGTTITLSIPVVVVPVEDHVEQKRSTSLTHTQACEILLIDDDASVRETLRDILEVLGHKVTTAEDGVEALVHLKNHKPDLILVDYAMPVMTGADVMKAAKLIYDDVPIVFVTGYSESAALEGYTVLKKPFTVAHIEDLLRTIF